MPATDLERLVVSLEARMTQYQRELQKAHGVTDRRAKQIERRFATMSKRVNAAGATAARGFVGAFGAIGVGAVGAFGLARLVAQAKEAADVFDKIGKSARTVGLSTDLFQTLEFAALEQGVEGVNTALDQFTKRSGEAAVGQGTLVTFLKKANPELLAQVNAAATQEQKLRLVAEAIREADSAAEKAALANAAFGRSGIGMVRVLNDGAAGLDDFSKRAREMGVIVDKDLIARSEDLANQLGVAAKVVDVEFKKAFIDLVPIIVVAARAISSVASAINNVVDAGQALPVQTTTGLQDQLNRVNTLLARTTPDDETQSISQAIINTQRASLERRRAELLGELKERAKGVIAAKVAGGQASPESDYTPSEASDNPDAFARSVEQIRQRTAELDNERRTIGLSAQEAEKARIAFELMEAAKEAGLEITPELTASVNDLAEAYAVSTIELDAARESQEVFASSLAEFKSTAGDTLKSFVSDMRDGATATEGLGNALASLADKLIDAGLDRLLEGVFAGLVGGFGGAPAASGVPTPRLRPFARGGISNRAAIFGEAGPEAAVPLPDGRRIPVDLRVPSLPASGARGGSNVTFAPVTSIDARGAGEGVAEELRADLDRRDREMERRIPAIVQQAQDNARFA